METGNGAHTMNLVINNLEYNCMEVGLAKWEHRCLANGTLDEKRTVKFPSVATAAGVVGESCLLPSSLFDAMPAFRSVIVHSFKFRSEREGEIERLEAKSRNA